MSCQKRSETMSIENPFPKEYEQLKSMLLVDGKKKTLNPNCSVDRFQVHPEYDLPYKMCAMILSEDRIEGIDKLNAHKNNKNNRKLCFNNKRKYPWKDYIFQIPNIYDMLGIKRDFKVNHVREVFQTPFLFMLLMDFRIYVIGYQNKGCLLYKEVMNLADNAIKAFEKKEETIELTDEQLEKCSFFLFDENIFNEQQFEEGDLHGSRYGYWMSDEERKAEAIEEKMHRILAQHSEKDEEPVILKEKNYKEYKGEIISFPEYMQSIILGLHEFYEYFPFVTTGQKVFDEKENNLWGSMRIAVTGSMMKDEEELWSSLLDLVKFMCYKQGMADLRWKYDNYTTYTEQMEVYIQQFWQPYREKIGGIYKKVGIGKKTEQNEHLKKVIYAAFESVRDEKKIEDLIENCCEACNKQEQNMCSVDEFLRKYYTFCIGTFQGVMKEEKLKEMTIYAFERLFSLYLFQEETKLFYEKVQTLADEAIQTGDCDESDREQLELNLAELIAQYFNTDIIHDIYCSPGIYHRILLSKYVNQQCIRKEEATSVSLLKLIATREIKSDVFFEDLRQEIINVNEEYFRIERGCLNTLLFVKDNELDYEYIKNLCDRVPEKSNYNTYYNEFEEAIEKKMGKTDQGKDRTPLIVAKKTAEMILDTKPFTSPAYRYLHFWVIFSSFLPEDMSWVGLDG